MNKSNGVKLLAALVALSCSSSGISCSTSAEPSEEEPPVCAYCDIGEQEVRCRTRILYDDNHLMYPPHEFQYTCTDPEADNEQMQQACLERCEEYAQTREDYDEELYECVLLDVANPAYWTGCVPPEATGDGGGHGHVCPGWYSPSTYVTDYTLVTSGTATVSVDRSYLLDINEYLFSLYVCDTARYAEQPLGEWKFVEIEPGDLLHELGIRNGDKNIVVQGFDPQTLQTTTSPILLNNQIRMVEAYNTLLEENGAKLSVERTGAPGGTFHIWATIE